MMLITKIPFAGLALVVCLLGCAGCSIPTFTWPKVGHDAKKEAVQETAATESIVAQAMDAATQALVQSATASWSSRMADPATAASSPIGASRTDLRVAFASLTDPAGHQRFSHSSGSFSVHAEGQAVPSWPLGTTVMAIHQVTIVFDQGPVAFTDPMSKVTATVTGGTFRYAVDTSYTLAADGSWTLKLDCEATVPKTAPLQVRIDRPHRSPHPVSIFGVRDAHLGLTREHGDGVDRLTAEATYDGTSADGATVVGVVGVDPQHPDLSFTNWDLTIDGREHVVWNRNFHVKAHWDFTQSPAKRTVDEMAEEIFITRNGEVSGPFTAIDLALFFHTSPN